MNALIRLAPRPVRLTPRRLQRFAATAARLGAAGGATAVEFALAAPVLIMLMLASVELGRFVILNQKLDRVAISTSDLVARSETIKESQIDDIFIAATQVAQPFELTELGRVIVSSIVNPDGDAPEVAWQRSDGGTLSAVSELGTEGGPATLPADFDVREGETAIIAEVFFEFEPFLSDLIVSPRTVYQRAYQRPRLGTLETVDPG